jgi:hypothetical protein
MVDQVPHAIEVPGRTLPLREATALVEKAQHLAGHFPTQEDLAAGRRILLGEISEEEAIAELDEKYRREET